MDIFEKFISLMPKGIIAITQFTAKGTFTDYIRTDKISDYNYKNMTNMFFTPNQLGYRCEKECDDKKAKINRDGGHLNKLCSLYVDIDLKNAKTNISVQDLITYAKNHIFGKYISEPTMIVSSGNGLHMYWLIEPLHWKDKEQWLIVQKYILSLFADYGADAKVSTDAVRLLRVPDTVNVKDKVTKCVPLELHESNVYNIDELCDTYGIKKSKSRIFDFCKNNSNEYTLCYSPQLLPNVYSIKDIKVKTSSCLFTELDTAHLDITQDAFRMHLEKHVFGLDMPYPTKVVMTNHSMRLYWLLDSITRKDYKRCELMQEYINGVFDNSILDDYKRVNTSNAQIYHILPSDDNDIVYDINTLCSDYNIVNDNVVSIKEKQGKQVKTRTNSDTPAQIINITDYEGKYCSLNVKRAKDIAKLLMIRDEQHAGNPAQTMYRECALFLYRYIQLELTKDKGLALDNTMNLNGKLKNGLSQKEVEKNTKSAEKYFSGNKLRWSNEKIVNFLNITDEEAKYMSTLLTQKEKLLREAARKERNKINQRDKYRISKGMMKSKEVFLRQVEVYKLVKKGVPAKEIMSLLQISKSTYYRDADIIKTEEWLSRLNSAVICDAQKAAKTGTTDTYEDVPKISVAYNYYYGNAVPSVSLVPPIMRGSPDYCLHDDS